MIIQFCFLLRKSRKRGGGIMNLDLKRYWPKLNAVDFTQAGARLDRGMARESNNAEGWQHGCFMDKLEIENMPRRLK